MPQFRRLPQRVVAAALALFVAGFVFSEAVRNVFFLFFMGFLFAVVLDYPVRLLARLFPRPIAAALVLFAIFGAIGTAARYGIPVLTEQGARVAEQVPESLDKLERWWNGLSRAAPVEGVPTGTEVKRQVRSSLRDRLGDLAAAALPVAGSALAAASSLLLTLVLATFMVASPATYADGIVRLVPVPYERVTRELLGRLVLTLRSWMVAQIISMTVVGALTAAGLFALGVKGWLVLGLVNFVAEFVPYIGPFAGAVPGVAVGFAESSRTGAYVLLLYVGIQQVEGYLVSPLAMRHEVRLAPPLLLLWQVLMAAAFGIPGVIVATPLLACVKVAVDFFWVERTLGKVPGPAPGR